MATAVLFIAAASAFSSRKGAIVVNSPDAKDTIPQKPQKATPDTTKKIDALRDTVISLRDSTANDTASTDSAHKKKGSLEAPVAYSATDSITYDANSKKAYLYGNGDVKYEDMELKAEQIEMNMDSSVVHAHGIKDSTKKWKGQPVYTQGSDNYKSDLMSFNFKTKKDT